MVFPTLSFACASDVDTGQTFSNEFLLWTDGMPAYNNRAGRRSPLFSGIAIQAFASQQLVKN